MKAVWQGQREEAGLNKPARRRWAQRRARRNHCLNTHYVPSTVLKTSQLLTQLHPPSHPVRREREVTSYISQTCNSSFIELRVLPNKTSSSRTWPPATRTSEQP